LRNQLQSTDFPFGAVVEPLGPSRRTTFARAMLAQNSLTLDDKVTAFKPILELHATVLTANHGPIARVHEVYGADLLLNMTAVHQHAHALSRDGTLAEI
jgi:hypothetical protein